MLNNIKSTYFLKEMISYISENIKLNLFRYNKAMQNILNINIINYKLFPGLIEVAEHRKMIKYGTDNYEGEYLNGKRHGKGKEYYYNGRSMFEGEYLNGKRWNGRGYNKNGIIDFEIKKGNGKGKEYNSDGKLKFEGE